MSGDNRTGLTDEQRRIVTHPADRHASVLAVAGSGKTTTMVERVAWLAGEAAIPCARIRVLAYNRDAAQLLATRLHRRGVSTVDVSTLHSLARSILLDDERRGGPVQRVIGEPELQRLHQRHLRAEGMLPDGLSAGRRRARLAEQSSLLGLVDAGSLPVEPPPPSAPPDSTARGSSARSAISPAPHAGTNEALALAGVDPGAQRALARTVSALDSMRAVTLDGMIRAAVLRLTDDEGLRRSWATRWTQLIVDEYQDVNGVQQELLRLVAGCSARVMVVGDDDQCIYQWRGARPELLRDGFQRAFPGAGHDRYVLSRTFRFGDEIAAVAASGIERNVDRVPKRLVSGRPGVASAVDVTRDDAAGVVATRLARGTRASEVAVLVRQWSAAAEISAGLCAAGIAWQAPEPIRWPDADAVALALDLATAAGAGDAVECEPGSGEGGSGEGGASEACTTERAVYVATARLVARALRLSGGALVRAALRELGRRWRDGLSTDAALRRVAASGSKPRRVNARLREVLEALRRTRQRACRRRGSVTPDRRLAHPLTDWLAAGGSVRDRAAAWRQVCRALLLVERGGLAAARRLLDAAGPQRQLDAWPPVDQPAERVTITTPFRAKGLEWPVVVVAGLEQGRFPDLRPVVGLSAAAQLEAERRLFYVAVTRAEREAVLCVPRGAVPSAFVAESCAHPVQALVRAERRLANAGAMRYVHALRVRHLRWRLERMNRSSRPDVDACRERADQPAP